ncbi:MAG TPA: Ig-like domain repeat protein, partial [Mycobacterium sp.]
GGTVGGSTTSQSNPLQTRNYASASGSTGDTQDNPTFLYGDLISTYLDNLETEYDPTLATGHVSYYPGGSVGGTGTPAAPAVAQQQVRKLQVPYLIGYQHGASQVSGLGDGGGSGGVTRQWIDPETDVNGLEYFKEYMTDWQYAAAQQNELGLATLPQDADIWDTINSELSNLTWQTNPASLAPNSAIDTDDAEYLDATDQATLSYNTGATPSLSVASGTSHSGTPTSYTTVPISPTALSNALAALGSAAPANYAGAKAALLAAIAGDADNGTSTALSDANLANLETVYGAWGVAQTRKNTVANVWPNVVFAQQAIHALDLFFGGFAGAQVTTQTVTANPFTAGTAGQVNVAIDSPYGAVPTGDVDLAVTQNGTTVYAASQAVAGNNASFTLPTNLAAGTYGYSVSYGADSEILGFSDTGSLTVDPAPDVPPPPPVTPPAPPVSQPAPPVSQPETPVSQPETPAVQSTAPAKATAAAKVHAKKVTGSVAKVTTTKVAGKYKVTVTAAAHKATPTGKITIKLKNGKRTKTLTGRLVRGSVTVAVPKLAKGTWKVTISWPGDSHYLSASAAGAVIRVTK